MSTSLETSEINRRFTGFRNTPFLWEGMLEELQMFTADEVTINDFPTRETTGHIRLGKLIELFVLFELKKDKSIEIIRENIQVFKNRITIGELDCLLKQLEEYVHLEIVYKFYLYDPSISGEVNRWIGPNRNDSLVQKLTKLKEKQLPLLYHTETAKLLSELDVSASEFKQEVYFKAQLFVPFTSLEKSFQDINNNCIKGFYIRREDLILFENHSYYIPAKLDWLVEPHLEVAWLSKEVFQNNISEFLSQNKAPLCWMKSTEGKLSKFFMVWWK